MSADDRLNGLLSQWEVLRDQGKTASADELCRTCPELAPELRRRIKALAAFDSVLQLERTPPPSSAATPGLFEETRQLLRARLILLLALFLVGGTLLLPVTLQNPVYAPIVRPLDYVGHAAQLVLALAVLLFLWRRRSLSMRSLRVIELTFFGLACAFLAVWQYRWELGGWLHDYAREGRGREAVQWASGNLIWPWLMLVMVYGTSIPNTGRRCAAVVAGITAVPVMLTLGVGLQDAVLRPHLLLDFLAGKLVVWLLIADAVVVSCSHRLSLLRSEVFAARELGQYRLTRRLGAGGMGEVYLAEHRLLRRPCAVKLIRPERGGDAGSLKRFEREVQSMATLNHWNTVEIYDYGRADDGTFYYVMEYLPGLSLEEMVEKHGPLPPERVVHLLLQVCAALREAHAAGLIHRDIKPSNLIVCERGGVFDVIKLLDFGLVKSVDRPRTGGLTLDGVIVGTPTYMSPEQAEGVRTLDGRTDIYSLGAVAYFLLTGHLVFDHENVMRIIAAHISDPVVPPSERQAGIGSDLQSVVLRCLEKVPAKRFASATALAEALGRCAADPLWTQERAAAWWQKQQPMAADANATNVPTTVQ